MLQVTPKYAISAETIEMASKCLAYVHKVGGGKQFISK